MLTADIQVIITIGIFSFHFEDHDVLCRLREVFFNFKICIYKKKIFLVIISTCNV